MLDKLGETIEVGCKMIFSAGKSVKIYEVIKTRSWNRDLDKGEVFVNIGSSKKWKDSRDGIIFKGGR